MTTSTTTLYELSRDSIIKAAMRKIAALAKGQTPDTEDTSNGQEALNALIAQYQTLGMPMWTRQEYSITLVANQRDYTIGEGQAIDTPFPLHILKANLVDSNGGSSQIVLPTGRTEFNLLNTSSTGRPINFSYVQYVNYGVLSVWPKPDSTAASNYTLKLLYNRPVYGFTSASETPDFPQEWQLPLIYGLAVLLAPEYGVPLDDRRQLESEAKKYLDNAMDFSTEDASLYLQPDRRF